MRACTTSIESHTPFSMSKHTCCLSRTHNQSCCCGLAVPDANTGVNTPTHSAPTHAAVRTYAKSNRTAEPEQDREGLPGTLEHGTFARPSHAALSAHSLKYQGLHTLYPSDEGASGAPTPVVFGVLHP